MPGSNTSEREFETVAAFVDPLDRVALAAQEFAEQSTQFHIVIDNQKAHPML